MRIRIPNLGRVVGVQPTNQRGQIAEAQRVAQQQAAEQQAQVSAQVAEYNRRLAEQAQKMREMQESAERTQAMMPPDAQEFGGPSGTADPRVRKRSNRGSLLAGETGGYNPATGSAGRLGGRSLLG